MISRSTTVIVKRWDQPAKPLFIPAPPSGKCLDYKSFDNLLKVGKFKTISKLRRPVIREDLGGVGGRGRRNRSPMIAVLDEGEVVVRRPQRGEEAFAEEAAVAREVEGGDPLIKLLGKMDGKYYKAAGQGWWDYLTTTYLWFYKNKDGRWLWATSKSGPWMSVAQMVVHPISKDSKGKYYSRVPKVDNQIRIKKLLVMERASSVGRVAPTISFLRRYIFGYASHYTRRGASTDWYYQLKVHGATTLYYKVVATRTGGPSRLAFYWSPFKNGLYKSRRFWFRASDNPKVRGTRSKYDNKAPNEWNVRLIKEMARWERLSSKGTETKCTATMKGDGYCDAACNTKTYNWDGGDCCQGTCESVRYPCGFGGYNCKGSKVKKKPCLFLHGLGRLGPRGAQGRGTIGVIESEPPPGTVDYGVNLYWGDMKTAMDGLCSHVYYNHADTVNHAYDDPKLMAFYYKEALKVYKQGGVIFAHSMANNILAAACMTDKKRCNVKWYDVAGPIRGSKAANMRSNFLARVIYGAMGDRIGPGAKSMLYEYKGMRRPKKPYEATKDKLSLTVYKNKLLKGYMCGITGQGAGYETGKGLATCKTLAYGNYRCVQWVAQYCAKLEPILSDGFVGLDECQMFGYKDKQGQYVQWYLMDKPATRNWRSRQFITTGNHQDVTGVYGNHDGIMSWFRHMVTTDTNRPH